eukprot:46466_1
MSQLMWKSCAFVAFLIAPNTINASILSYLNKANVKETLNLIKEESEIAQVLGTENEKHVIEEKKPEIAKDDELNKNGQLQQIQSYLEKQAIVQETINLIKEEIEIEKHVIEEVQSQIVEEDENLEVLEAVADEITIEGWTIDVNPVLKKLVRRAKLARAWLVNQLRNSVDQTRNRIVALKRSLTKQVVECWNAENAVYSFF